LLVAAVFLALATLVQRNYVPVTRAATISLPISDNALYAKIVDRVRGGEDYYAVVANEHRKYGYPTRPATVFREPTAALLLALLPGPMFRWAALLTLAAGAAFATRQALQKTALSPRTQLAAMLAVAVGLSNLGMPNAPYMHELWASLLILLSLCAYQMERVALAALLGLGACLFRELALPYVLAMGFVDVLERRWRRVLWWSAAAAAFAGIYSLHLQKAATLYRPGDLVSQGWVRFGGWPFAILTARRNSFLLLAPSWVVASVVTASAIGLVGCRDRWVSRIALVVLGYLAAVLVVGRPENAYWGELWAPLLPIGLALAPAAFWDLLRQAGWAPARRTASANA
jgi:hypothetical protein